MQHAMALGLLLLLGCALALWIASAFGTRQPDAPHLALQPATPAKRPGQHAEPKLLMSEQRAVEHGRGRLRRARHRVVLSRQLGRRHGSALMRRGPKRLHRSRRVRLRRRIGAWRTLHRRTGTPVQQGIRARSRARRQARMLSRRERRAGSERRLGQSPAT